MRIRSAARTVALIGLGLTAASTTPGLAQQDIGGTWLRETGGSRVRFSTCGDAVCGTLAWLRDADSPAKVGQRIFYDMKPDGVGKWKGSAFNPEDGKTYSGTMSLAGDKLITSGCVFGGLICRSVNWSRSN